MDNMKKNLNILVYLALTTMLTAFTFGCSGCKHTVTATGAYKGDTYLYDTEVAINTSYTIIHEYVLWEKANTVFLQKWPEIKKSADVIRDHSRDWFATANTAHDVYKVNPTAENKKALKLAMDAISAALSEATRYMTMVSNPKP